MTHSYELDSSIALMWFLGDSDSARTVQLQEQLNQQIHELLAPDVVPVVTAHALPREERRSVIQPPGGFQHLSDSLADGL
jgi:hypothetical protein